MSMNPLASALRAIGTQGTQAVQGTQPSKAHAFGAIGKDFDFLMQALGSSDPKKSPLDTLMQGLSVTRSSVSGQADQAGSAAPLRFDSQASGIASAAPQVSALQAIRFVNAVTAPLVSVGKNISVTA